MKSKIIFSILILGTLLIPSAVAQTVNGSSLNINGNGRINGLLYSSQTTTNRLTLQGYGVWTPTNPIRANNDLTLFDGASMGSASFLDDWLAGYGFRLAYQDSGYTLTLDNLNIRGTLRAHEFLIDQTKASNGDMIITSSAMVDSVKFHMLAGADWFMTVDVTNHNVSPFWAGDIIMCQMVNTSGATFNSNGDYNTTTYLTKRLIYKVDSTSGLKVYYSTLSGAPVNVGYVQKGDVFVRLGNTSLSTNRNGTIGLYVNQKYSPYLRVTDSVNSWSAWKNQNNIKLQLGRLDGIVDSSFGGSLSGYGLYSQNAYLKGKIIMSGGSSIPSGIAMWDSLGNRPNYVLPPSGYTRWDSLVTTYTSAASLWNLVGKGLFIDNTHFGFFDATNYPNSPWRTYMDSTGNFYLTGVNGDELAWSNGHLSITSGGTAFSTLATNVTNQGDSLIVHRTEINQNTASIQLKANSTTTDSLRNRVTTAEGNITVNSDSVNILSSRTIAHGDSITNLRGSIVTTADQITLEVSRRLADSSSVHSSLTLNANNISALVDSVSKHRTMIDSNYTAIIQNANSILLKANSTTTDSLRSRIQTAESDIAINSDSVSVFSLRTLAQGDSIKNLRSFISVSADSVSILSSRTIAYGDSISSLRSSINVNADSITLYSTGHIRLNGNTTVEGTFQLNGNALINGTVIADSVRSTYLYAKTMVGGTINIGGGNFMVDGSGNLSAENGYFRGTVYASHVDTTGGGLPGGYINNGTITYNKLNVTSLSAISATLGTVTSGTLRGGTFSTGQTQDDPNGIAIYSNYLQWGAGYTITLSGSDLSCNTSFNASTLKVGGHTLNFSDLAGNGSTNITTVGTITSGTWHGTAIGTSYLPTIPISKGGTGTTSFTDQKYIYYDVGTGTFVSSAYSEGSFLTSESDPTVYAWAKASTKPSYTFSEIGGTISNAQLNLGTTSSSPNAGGVTISAYYGSSTSTVLMAPPTWLILHDSAGNSYKVPAY